jgi:hypothetical protein
LPRPAKRCLPDNSSVLPRAPASCRGALARSVAPRGPARGSPDAPERQTTTDDPCVPMRPATASTTRAGHALAGCAARGGGRVNATRMVRLLGKCRWPALALAALAFLSPNASQAITCPWKGTGGSGGINWSTAKRWTLTGARCSAAFPPSANDAAVFNTGSVAAPSTTATGRERSGDRQRYPGRRHQHHDAVSGNGLNYGATTGSVVFNGPAATNKILSAGSPFDDVSVTGTGTWTLADRMDTPAPRRPSTRAPSTRSASSRRRRPTWSPTGSWTWAGSQGERLLGKWKHQDLDRESGLDRLQPARRHHLLQSVGPDPR